MGRGVEMTVVRAEAIARTLAAVGEPTRMRVMDELALGPAALGELATRTGLRVANLAHHMSVLRGAGIVAQVRRGRSVVYQLDESFYKRRRTGAGTLSVEGWVVEVGRSGRSGGESVSS